jgi:hypothetical protein
VKILHGSALRTQKPRVKTPKKDNRALVGIRFGSEKFAFGRDRYPSYQRLLEETRSQISLPESWPITRIRAEDDFLIIECADGVDPFWFSEKACPR